MDDDQRRANLGIPLGLPPEQEDKYLIGVRQELNRKLEDAKAEHRRKLEAQKKVIQDE